MKSKLILSLCSILAILGMVATVDNQRAVSQCQATKPFEDEGQVTLTAKAYNEEESAAYLNKNLIEHGFRPIQITVENKSSKSFSISPSGFNVPAATTDDVTSQILVSKIPVSAALSIAGFFFWPVSALSAASSVVSYKSHRKTVRSLRAKAVKQEVIPAFSSVNRILLVKEKEMPEGKLTLTLIDIESLSPLVCDSALG